MPWWKWNRPTHEYLLLADDGVTIMDRATNLPRGIPDTVGLDFPRAGEHPKVKELLGLKAPAPAMPPATGGQGTLF